jgi:hypothetical protein
MMFPEPVYFVILVIQTTTRVPGTNTQNKTHAGNTVTVSTHVSSQTLLNLLKPDGYYMYHPL